jgi:hypothetical protein
MSEDVDPFRRVKAFAGTGKLSSGSRDMACRFDACQRGDGAIVIECKGDAPPEAMHPLPWDLQLVGATERGQHVLSHGAHATETTFHIFGGHGPNTRVRLIAEGLDVGPTAPAEAHGAMTLRYGLTNLNHFPGEDVPFHAGDFIVRIKHRPDAEAVLKELKATQGIALTAEATLTAVLDQIATADDAIRKLCHLLTLGQGCAVSWVYRDSIDKDDQVVATFCVDAITKPYGSAHRLIPDHDMRAFVEATLPAWDDAESRWEICNAILGYTDAKIEIDYHELKALKMAVVIEHLKRVYLERTGREYTLPEQVFKSKSKELRSRLMSVLKELFSGQTEQTLRCLAAGLQGLNRTSFKDAVKGVLAEVRLPVDVKELAALVPVRNRLVHAMQFSPDVQLSHVEQHGLLTTFAGRLILAALGYEGSYYDWTKRPPQIVKLKRLPVQVHPVGREGTSSEVF